MSFIQDFYRIFVEMLPGIAMSMELFVLTLVFSLPLGLVIAFGRMTKIAPIRWITKLYISIMRGTPLMLQLFIVFYGPWLIFKIPISMNYRFPAAIIAFSINYAAYFAEIYRGGIESMPVGQYEAANVLGYSKSQTFFKIILPQVFKRILPSITNEVITLVKDTSLAFAIALLEMFTIAKQIATRETSLVPYLVAGICYYIFNYVVAFLMEKIEKKFQYYR